MKSLTDDSRSANYERSSRSRFFVLTKHQEKRDNTFKDSERGLAFANAQPLNLGPMHLIRRFAAFGLMSLASTALFIACADEQTCIADADCDTEEEVCEDEVCRPLCTLDSDCEEGACVPRSSGNLSYCDPNTDQVDPNNDIDFGTSEDMSSGTSTQLLLIEDTSSGAEACDTEDPGADIWSVILSDSRGNPKGWGNLVVDQTTGATNEFALGLNLNGNPPASTTMCPEFTVDNVTALGCGGSVVVEFTGPDDVPVQAVEDDQIEILEFGAPVCPTATTADRYRASHCTDVEAVKNNEDTTSCTISLVSEASGPTTNTVTY